jgi:hypothetical protein
MFADYLEKMQTDPVAGFTALLALATLILVGIAYLQIRQGRIVQRAYVAVEPLGVHLMVEGDRVIGHIGIRNAGRLPARQLSWFINIKHSNKVSGAPPPPCPTRAELQDAN